MNVVFTKQFNKDILKITDKNLALRIEHTIIEVKKAVNLTQITNLKKLSGYKNSYRIRVGDYRIGLYFNGNTLEFARFLNRREIYRYFPS
jgi:mRNA interferase RelE/StbE